MRLRRNRFRHRKPGREQLHQDFEFPYRPRTLPAGKQVGIADEFTRQPPAQVFTEHGEYLDEWYVGDDPSRIHLVIIDSNRNVWAYDRGTHKVIKYDLEGNFLYQFGTYGLFPGYFWGVHDMAVDQEGNFYVAEVNKGGAQKFRPRPGAKPDFLVGRPVYSAWK